MRGKRRAKVRENTRETRGKSSEEWRTMSGPKRSQVCTSTSEKASLYFKMSDVRRASGPRLSRSSTQALQSSGGTTPLQSHAISLRQRRLELTSSDPVAREDVLGDDEAVAVEHLLLQPRELTLVDRALVRDL